MISEILVSKALKKKFVLVNLKSKITVLAAETISQQEKPSSTEDKQEETTEIPDANNKSTVPDWFY